ncbi:MAG: YnbE family lipoprotein [Alteromonadaceae bacterium]|nr:MAG: YnbE family lipoprotein [Alteromonadaceae bacterium]
MKAASYLLLIPLVGIASASMVSCTPTLKVEASDKPITINLNINIKHEIVVKVDKALESVFSEDSGLF